MKIILSAFLSLILAVQPLLANLDPLRAESNEIDLRVFKNGQVSGGSYFGGEDLVVWVQDLHMNPQAQKNITAIIDELREKAHVKKVYAEGIVQGKADVSVLDSIPDAINKENTVNYLYDKGFLSAAEYIALNGYDVYGVENKEIYAETLAVIEEIIKNDNNDFRQKVDDLSETVKALQNQYFSKKALSFNKSISKNQNKVLIRSFQKSKDLLSYYPNLYKYTGYGISNKFSPEEINKELVLCLDDLKKNTTYSKYSAVVAGLNEGSSDSLMKLYDTLLSDAPETLEKYAKLNGFFIKQKELLQLNKVELFFEEQNFTDELAYINSPKDLDKELLALSKAVKVLEAYSGLAVNSIQYQELKNNRDHYKELFNKYFEEAQRLFAVNLLYDKKREQFYENNILRDNIFCGELLKDINLSPSGYASGPEEILRDLANFDNVNIIIAGGFHYGIADTLNKKEISYLIVTPDINYVNEERKYHDFILYGANTFNKVFHADFDFGSAEKVLNGFVSVVSRWGGYSVSAQDLEKAINEWILSCEKINGISVSVSEAENGYKISAAYQDTEIEADVVIKDSGEIESLNRKIEKYGAEKVLSASESEDSIEQGAVVDGGIKPLSLIDPFLKTRAQKVLAAMFMPAVESVLWIPMIAALFITPASAVIMPFIFALLHNVFKAAAQKTIGEKYTFKMFARDFAGYFISSAGLSAATSAAFLLASLITVNPVIIMFVALISNICAHYAHEIYRLSGSTQYKSDKYYSELKNKYAGDIHKINMTEALKEAETARLEEPEIKTFLKPPVGAFITDNEGNSGRGFNRENSLLHAEYFAFISYLTNYIDKTERDDISGYTEKGRMLSNLLNAAILNAETLNRRVFERNPYLLSSLGFDVDYPLVRTIDDVFNETNLIFQHINRQLGDPLGNASLYCTLAPCNKCSKIMAGLKIKELVYASPSINKSHKGKNALEQAGIKVTGEILAEEAGEYIENYKVANKSPLRTSIASFIQTVSRKMKGLFDLTVAEAFDIRDFGAMFKKQGDIPKNIHDNIYAKADNIVVQIASSPELYLASVENLGRYASGSVTPVVFTRLGFEPDTSGMSKFAPVFTAKNDAGSAAFEVYFKDSVFYIKIAAIQNIDENKVYELAYIQLLKELKDGVLSPSANQNTKNIFNSDNIEIIAVEGGFDGETNTILADYIEEYKETSVNNWGSFENIKKYELMAQMNSEIEELRGRAKENERVETRNLLTGSSVGINIASLSTDSGMGKIKDIMTFVNVVKDSFRALNISGYMPFKKTSWMDDIYIDWQEEAFRLSEEGYDISSDEIDYIHQFYSANSGNWKDGINSEKSAEIVRFEEDTARRFLAKIKGISVENISENDLRDYRSVVKEIQIKDIIAKANIEGVDVTAEYIYDKTLSEKENLESIAKILELFNGIVIRLDKAALDNISDDIYKISAGKPVAFRLDESDRDVISSADIEVKKDYGFRVVREFSQDEDTYDKVISVPAEKISDTVMEKLNNSSAVIISVPETSGGVIEKLSDIKNGANIISSIMNAARNIKTSSAEKDLQNYYLHGVNIAEKAKRYLGRELFGGNVDISGVKGRGLLAVLNMLDNAEITESGMAEVFETVETIVSGADVQAAQRITLITDKIKKQYENGDERSRQTAVGSLKQFIFGIYFQTEILSLPAFEKYEGEYVQRAGNYAADARKHIINADNGLIIDGSLRDSLKSAYFLISSDMLSKDEIIKILDNYSAVIGRSGIESQFLFAVLLGQASAKYDRKEFLKYSQAVRSNIVSYKASDNEKWLHIASLASVAYVENDNDLKRLVNGNFNEPVMFEEYDFSNMLMAVTLIELLDFSHDMFAFNITRDSALEKIYQDNEIAGLYAKLFKLTSSYSVSGITAELQSVLEGFSITPMRRYSNTGNNVKAASIAMALTELCELAGFKTDTDSLKKAAKTTSVFAIRSILSAA